MTRSTRRDRAEEVSPRPSPARDDHETSLTSSRSPEAKPMTARTTPPASISIPQPSSGCPGVAPGARTGSDRPGERCKEGDERGKEVDGAARPDPAGRRRRSRRPSRRPPPAEAAGRTPRSRRRDPEREGGDDQRRGAGVEPLLPTRRARSRRRAEADRDQATAQCGGRPVFADGRSRTGSPRRRGSGSRPSGTAGSTRSRLHPEVRGSPR